MTECIDCGRGFEIVSLSLLLGLIETSEVRSRGQVGREVLGQQLHPPLQDCMARPSGGKANRPCDDPSMAVQGEFSLFPLKPSLRLLLAALNRQLQVPCTLNWSLIIGMWTMGVVFAGGTRGNEMPRY